jgi:hypothetical protein
MAVSLGSIKRSKLFIDPFRIFKTTPQRIVNNKPLIMKKLIVLLAILSTGFVSCSKRDDCVAATEENLSVENATVVAAGDLSFTVKTGTGSAKVYRQQNGGYVLGLEGMNLAAGRSLVVYLSGSKALSAQAIKIFSATSLNGNVLHLLPPNIDLLLFKHLIILSEPSEEMVASAELN